MLQNYVKKLQKGAKLIQDVAKSCKTFEKIAQKDTRRRMRRLYMEDSGLVNWQRCTRNEYEHFSARRWMAILIPKILRYSFIQAQCRQALLGTYAIAVACAFD